MFWTIFPLFAHILHTYKHTHTTAFQTRELMETRKALPGEMLFPEGLNGVYRYSLVVKKLGLKIFLRQP